MHLITRREPPDGAPARGRGARRSPKSRWRLPVRPNSLTSVLTGLAASQHFEIDIRFEAGSTPLIRDVMLASDLATISPREVFSREIAAGELSAVPIVRPKILQTTWMSLSSHHPPSEAARIVARLIRQMAARRQRGELGLRDAAIGDQIDAGRVAGVIRIVIPGRALPPRNLEVLRSCNCTSEFDAAHRPGTTTPVQAALLALRRSSTGSSSEGSGRCV